MHLSIYYLSILCDLSSNHHSSVIYLSFIIISKSISHHLSLSSISHLSVVYNLSTIYVTQHLLIVSSVNHLHHQPSVITPVSICLSTTLSITYLSVSFGLGNFLSPSSPLSLSCPHTPPASLRQNSTHGKLHAFRVKGLLRSGYDITHRLQNYPPVPL